MSMARLVCLHGLKSLGIEQARSTLLPVQRSTARGGATSGASSAEAVGTSVNSVSDTSAAVTTESTTTCSSDLRPAPAQEAAGSLSSDEAPPAVQPVPRAIRSARENRLLFNGKTRE